MIDRYNEYLMYIIYIYIQINSCNSTSLGNVVIV